MIQKAWFNTPSPARAVKQPAHEWEDHTLQGKEAEKHAGFTTAVND